MTRSRAAIVIFLLACGAGCIGYLVGSGVSVNGATGSEGRQPGAVTSPPARGQSGLEDLVHGLDLGGVSGQQRAILDAVNAWLSEDGSAALVKASDDDRFEPILQGMVELAARVSPNALIDAMSRDSSGRLAQVVPRDDLFLATSVLARADVPAETANAMRQLAQTLGEGEWLGAWARYLAQTDLDLAIDVADGFRGTGQALFLLSVAENLPRDAASVTAWLDRYAGHPTHSKLLEAAVNNLARRDVDAAAELVESLSFAAHEVAFDFIPVLATNNPGKAIALFSNNTRDIAAGWAEIDPDAAIAWFADNGMYENNMAFDALLMVLARTAPARAEKILADYPASELRRSYPAAVLAEYLDEDEDALRLIDHYGLDETSTMRRRAEIWERIDSCPPM